MTFSAAGSNIAAQATTFTLAPTGVGNFILLEVLTVQQAVSPTGMSSSNVTWSALTNTFNGTTNAWQSRIFIGTVTSTSSQTVTLSWSGTTPSGIDIMGHEFSSTAGASAVSLDKQGNLDSAGTGNWVSLTPLAAGELYFGYALNHTSAVAGSTSGYTYSINAVTQNGMAYDVSTGASATFPAWGDATEGLGTMVLLTDVNVISSGPPLPSQFMGQRPVSIATNSGWRSGQHSR